MTELLNSFGFGSTQAIDIASLLLRVSLGGLFLAHAWLKVFVFTPKGAAGFFQSLGLPGFFAYLTIAAEVVGGVALIIGLWTSLAALLLIPVIAGAGWFAHRQNGFWFNNTNGGWEYPAFWSLALLVQALLGGGALVVSGL
ncbi:putative oxidoreductase [Rhodobacter aestuarii]|uniref:Putative oxidoreductase n=1 Tax=Rhodobacter aestuarii TaxID=453582 RepID=A0A1N7Q4V7_9RHOB|nr:DoxX family protein [Rhodobacter aestuarii]PTV93901.1 putative oxidoreductase [Rhodobacter aestuarii]SIT17846.1 putative oxidoreductase [Rhodobacter aestuarii]